MSHLCHRKLSSKKKVVFQALANSKVLDQEVSIAGTSKVHSNHSEELLKNQPKW